MCARKLKKVVKLKEDLRWLAGMSTNFDDFLRFLGGCVFALRRQTPESKSTTYSWS